MRAYIRLATRAILLVGWLVETYQYAECKIPSIKKKGCVVTPNNQASLGIIVQSKKRWPFFRRRGIFWRCALN